jgi:two-component system cell cycle response regulator
VILCKRKAQAEEALKVVKGIMDKLELTLHGEKTRLVDMYFGKDSFDTYGHISGDQTLIRIAEVIKGVIKRAGEFAARYGGEEFVAILMNTTAEGAAFVAEQIRTRVEELGIENREIKNVVTVSLGVASVVPDNEMEPNELIDAADRALYKAKEYGRNNVTVWESQQE